MEKLKKKILFNLATIGVIGIIYVIFLRNLTWGLTFFISIIFYDIGDLILFYVKWPNSKKKIKICKILTWFGIILIVFSFIYVLFKIYEEKHPVGQFYLYGVGFGAIIFYLFMELAYPNLKKNKQFADLCILMQLSILVFATFIITIIVYNTSTIYPMWMFIFSYPLFCGLFMWFGWDLYKFQILNEKIRRRLI
jgi:hypothetical protein